MAEAAYPAHFIRSPVRFRFARYPKASVRPEDLDARGRPLVHVAVACDPAMSPTGGPTRAWASACGLVVPAGDVERFAGGWAVTCPTCHRKDRPR